MLKQTIARIWQTLPSSVRRAALRVTNAKFTVTAAAVIFDKQGKVLVLKHRFRPGSGWGLPGGFIKSDEQPLEALHRELKEEIGLEITDVEILWARSFQRPRQVEILFCANAASRPQSQSIEVEELRWCAINELPEGVPENQRLLVERAVEKRQV